jgi:hypothetical protein
MFKFTLDNGLINFTGNLFSFRNIKLMIEVNTVPVGLEINETSATGFEVTVPGTGIRGLLNIGTFRDMTTMEIEFLNDSNSDYSLGKCAFISDSQIFMPDDTVLILQRGECARNRNIRLADIEKSDESTVFTTLNEKGIGGLSIGFISFDRIFCKIDYTESVVSDSFVNSLSSAEKSRHSLNAYCNFNGFTIKPGASIKTETFYIEENKDPYSLLLSFAEAVKYRYKIKPRQKMPIGWIGGWNFRDGFTKENHEKLVMQNAKAINERLSGFGIEYIWISTVNTRDNLPGNWDKDNVYNFPNGLEYLSGYLKERGLKTGLWIAPFWMNEASENMRLVKNAIAVKNGEKVITETGRITHQPFNGKRPEELPRVYYLDPTHSELHDFLKKIFRYYNDIGIRYYMVDFLLHGIDPEYDLHDTSVVNGPESYRMSMKIISDTVTEDTYLLSSSGPTLYNIGLVDGVRAARDFGEGRPVTKYCWYYPANYLTNNFELIKEVTRDYAITHPNNRRLYVNDSFNMITVGKPVAKNEARIVSTLFGLSGNPVMMGDDIPSISEERLAMIKKILPLHEGTMLPCDLYESCWPDTPHVFRLDVKKHYDEFTIMAVFNFNNEPMTATLNTGEFLKDKSEYIVFDFWNEHCIGRAGGKFDIHVPPRDVRVIRLTKTRCHPWIIGSDMHITQGDVELRHLRWDPDEMTLKGTCNRPEGETGRLFMHIPDGFEPVDFRELFIIREETLDIGPDEKMIVGMKSLYFDVETTDFCIEFRKSVLDL